MRIRIPINETTFLASRLRAASVEVTNSRRILQRAAFRLEWEVSRRPEVDSLIHRALVKADLLAEEAYRLSEYVKLTGTRFQDVDSQFIFKVQPLPAPERLRVFSLKSSINPYSAVQSMPSPQTKSLGWIRGVIT